MADVPLNPWIPMTSPIGLKHLGKLGEEVNELGAAIFRCIIQGIDECEPVTKVPNRRWLESEVADVYAGLKLLIDHYDLDSAYIRNRMTEKMNGLSKWHKMLT